MFSEITHDFEPEIICPYCNYEFDNSFEINPDVEDIGLIDCSCCGNEFFAHRNVEITYSTTKARFGTCLSCGAKDVPLENFDAIYGSYKDLCPDCGIMKRDALFREFYKKNYEDLQ